MLKTNRIVFACYRNLRISHIFIAATKSAPMLASPQQTEPQPATSRIFSTCARHVKQAMMHVFEQRFEASHDQYYFRVRSDKAVYPTARRASCWIYLKRT